MGERGLNIRIRRNQPRFDLATSMLLRVCLHLIFLWFWGVNSHVFNKIEKLEFDTLSFMVLRKIMQFWTQGFIICINQLSNRMFRKKRAPSCLSLRILEMKMSVSWHVHKNSTFLQYKHFYWLNLSMIILIILSVFINKFLSQRISLFFFSWKLL